MYPFSPTDVQVSAFHADGYLMVRGLFDAEETDLLLKIARADARLDGDKLARRDAQGGVTRLALRNELGDDIYSAVTRSRRIVDTMEILLGGEVYHYHHKMNMKEPFVGGAWEWHQDYGYWYNNGCLFPDMASCMIAVDKATRENGCLQVIRGSQRMGRIEHGVTGDQTGADMERVNEALKRLELIYCEMAPGDALFFHSNLLHRSDQNRSAEPRWALISCYNAASNNPYKIHHHPSYSPLVKGDDEDVKTAGYYQWIAMQDTVRTVTLA
ncbi:MAG: Phytanoyl-CoA dioxygenase family protein [Chthonomonadaceae bacterium]|nr:Phytanoyl-CoA dioxygenase family protein [Chthonomonadaceae bacterium]